MVWEYKTIKVSYDKSFIKGTNTNVETITGELNGLGKQGWELVSAFDTARSGESCEVVIIFKREGGN